MALQESTLQWTSARLQKLFMFVQEVGMMFLLVPLNLLNPISMSSHVLILNHAQVKANLS